MQHTLVRSSLATITDASAAEYGAFLTAGNLPTDDAEWLRGYFAGELDNLIAYMLSDGGSLSGVAHFLKRDWPLKWHLGELRVASLPLQRLLLLGPTPHFPEDQAAFDLLFSELAKTAQSFQAVFVAEVPVESYFWKYLNESKVIGKHFLTHQPEAPSPYPILRFEGSFDDYMGKLPKHRKNLTREVRKIWEGFLGEMRFVRFESPEEVPAFLSDAVELSKKTYQWVLHGRGLSATDLVRRRLLFAAQHGWMRSYLLYCGGSACAFIVGFQYRGRFLLHETGFDPALARFSVGTVLLLLAIEDLFAHNRAEILDLGDYGGCKAMFSTESYLQGNMFLFQRGLYPRFLRTGHMAFAHATKAASTCLEHLGWRSRLRNCAPAG
jgi:hypothetical protein